MVAINSTYIFSKKSKLLGMGGVLVGRNVGGLDGAELGVLVGIVDGNELGSFDGTSLGI